jgi:hypothetical protein
MQDGFVLRVLASSSDFAQPGVVPRAPFPTNRPRPPAKREEELERWAAGAAGRVRELGRRLGARLEVLAVAQEVARRELALAAADVAGLEVRPPPGCQRALPRAANSRSGLQAFVAAVIALVWAHGRLEAARSPRFGCDMPFPLVRCQPRPPTPRPQAASGTTPRPHARHPGAPAGTAAPRGGAARGLAVALEIARSVSSGGAALERDLGYDPAAGTNAAVNGQGGGERRAAAAPGGAHDRAPSFAWAAARACGLPAAGPAAAAAGEGGAGGGSFTFLASPGKEGPGGGGAGCGEGGFETPRAPEEQGAGGAGPDKRAESAPGAGCFEAGFETPRAAEGDDERGAGDAAPRGGRRAASALDQRAAGGQRAGGGAPLNKRLAAVGAAAGARPQPSSRSPGWRLRGHRWERIVGAGRE